LANKTLVLDLDETLVHSAFTAPKRGEKPSDLILNVKWEDGITDQVYVNVRPYVNRFLLEMSKIFEIVIFTASVISYARPLVKLLNVKNKDIPILWRRHCTYNKEMK
jgi:RNA polymerase II subunit A small phosphatase-like protein